MEISGPFYAPGVLTLTDNDGPPLVRDRTPIAGHEGLCYEAAHFATLIAEGATDSPLLPLDETVAVLRTIDEARRQLGVALPRRVARPSDSVT